MWLAATVVGLLFSPATVGLHVPAENALERLRNHSRVLLVFAPNAHDARLQQQSAELLAHGADVTERQLVVIPVLEPAASGEAHEDLKTDQQLNPADAAALRRQFRVKDGIFLVVLVGKDGGEKLRSRSVLGFDRLRDVIDAMPMRQEEIREKKIQHQ